MATPATVQQAPKFTLTATDGPVSVSMTVTDESDLDGVRRQIERELRQRVSDRRCLR